MRGEDSQLAQRLGKLDRAARGGLGPHAAAQPAARRSRGRDAPRSVSASGAPTATTTSPSELSSAATCAPEPGSKKIADSRIGGSGVRTSSSIASWSEPCIRTTPQ